MKKSSLLITFLFCSICFSALASSGPLWSAVYQGLGDNSDRFNKIIPDGSGNFIAVGYTFKEANYRDILTVKYDANGNVLWSQTKNGGQNGIDEGIACGVDGSGNVFVTGYRDGGKSNDDIVTIKYDPNGVTVWDTAWDSPASFDDRPVDLKIDAAGNCIIGGVAEPDTFSGSSDYITLKYDANGVLLWSNQFSRAGVSNGKDQLTGLAIDGNNDVYVTGRSGNGINDDFVTIKYDGNTGAQSWMQPYNGGNDDRAVAICIDNAGNVIVTGRSDNSGTDDVRTIKYNNLGLLQWTKAYNSPTAENDRPTALAVDLSDNVIVVGESDVTGGAGSDLNYLTLKYNSAGTIQWASRTTGNTVPQDDSPTSVAVDINGNIYVTGKTDQNIQPGFVDNDFMTVMYNTGGALQWTKFHSGSLTGDDDIASCIIEDNGSVYVVGGAVNTGTQKDAVVIKYDETNGNETWIQQFNGRGDFSESAKAIVIDANDNAYAAGYTVSENNNLDAIVSKFDPTGILLCNYIYKGVKNDDDEFEAVAIGPNGNIFAAGYTKVQDQKSNYLVVKINAGSCDTAWTRMYDYIGQADRATGILTDASGNVYVTGRSDSDPNDTTDNNDILTIKYDNNGNVQWTQRFAGSANMRDEPAKMILDNSGNIIIAGRSENVHDDDFIVIKYNAASGAPVWSQPTIYGGPFANDDRATDVAVDGSGNIFVCGFSQTASGNSTEDPVLLKLDASGTQQAFYSYAGLGKDEPVKIAADQSGNVFCMFKYDSGAGLSPNNNDIQLQKFDNMLLPLWSSPPTYDSPVHGDDNPADMIITPLGDVFLTGSTENDTVAGTVNKNWITLGYTTNGNIIFSENFNGANSTDDSPNAIVMHGNFLWVAGYSEGTGNNQKDLTVNKYGLPLAISETEPNLAATAFPNPFNISTRISFSKPVINGYVELFDLSGKSVSVKESVNGNSATIDRRNLAPGVYIFSVISSAAVIAHGKLIVD